MRIGAHHGFAVHFQDQAQHAVRRRMLRAEVHRVIADFLLAFGRIAREGIGCLAELTHLAVSDPAHFTSGSLITGIVANHARHADARLDRGHRLVHHTLALFVVAHFDVADQREILAERVADESIVGQDAAQVRVTIEHDAEQVECFALEPVHARPDIGHRRHQRHLFVRCIATHAQTLVVLVGNQLRDHRKTLLGQLLRLRASGAFLAGELTPGETTDRLAFDAAAEPLRRHVGGIPLAAAVAEVIDAAQVAELLETELVA